LSIFQFSATAACATGLLGLSGRGCRLSGQQAWPIMIM